ncbi:MAG TPA: hypothetical protein VM261_33575 [Kofleriaceae bacterium]|nr:hypothetical protein [Kofleriaceae bacterium]
MFSKSHHEFERAIDEAVDGPATSDALDPDLKRELVFAASRGAEALEGLLACLDSGQRHAAFFYLQTEEGNNATARGLGRKSADEENYLARRAALDATPDATPKVAPKEAVREVTERAQAEVSAQAAEPAAAPAATAESNAAMLDSIGERADALSQEVKDERDNHAAREAYLAKKYEGDDLMARAMARVTRKSS